MVATEISLPFRPFGCAPLVKPLLILFGLILSVFLFPLGVNAEVISNDGIDGSEFIRSLETVRDLDFQSWQVVVYREGNNKQGEVLRVVGYPGKVRLDHPTDLLVHSGRHDWILNDITLLNPQLVKDGREAAAEFDIAPLLTDLNNNRPLRLELPGVFVELPIPPYLVKEWRYFLRDSMEAESN